MKNLDQNWIVGFTDGEGTFYVGINRHSEMQSGFQVLPEFRIVQHKKDIQLLHKIKAFFKCGVIRVNHGDRYELRIRKLEHLHEIVIPFFTNHKLQTKKSLDFIIFKRIINLMQQDEHLTKDGIEKIIKLADRMNRGDKSITKHNFYSGDKDIVHAPTKIGE